jgi:hypothetical protein
MAPLTGCAEFSASEGDPEPLRNGVDRPVGKNDNGWTASPGAWAQYTWNRVVPISCVRLVFDSDLYANGLGMPHAYPLDQEDATPPETLVKAFRLETRDADSNWRTVHEAAENYQRLVRFPLNTSATAIRFTPLSTWGAALAHVQAFEVK